tara:strand:+ start:919 stop:1212 length:294 start_codon:yes stop_codon:yes gene_type:complete
MGNKITDFKSVAKEIANLLSKGEQNSLVAVMLAGEGRGFYYSLVDKKPVEVPRRAEYYLLPFEEDSEGRMYVFTTHIFYSGLILLVPKEQIELIGYN